MQQPRKCAMSEANIIPQAVPESIMKFPCDVPVTAIGVRVDGLAQAIAECVSTVVKTFDATTIEMRPSKAGTYLAVAFMVHVDTMAHLEELNTVLKAHPLVKYVL